MKHKSEVIKIIVYNRTRQYSNFATIMIVQEHIMTVNIITIVLNVIKIMCTHR